MDEELSSTCFEQKQFKTKVSTNQAKVRVKSKRINMAQFEC